MAAPLAVSTVTVALIEIGGSAGTLLLLVPVVVLVAAVIMYGRSPSAPLPQQRETNEPASAAVLEPATAKTGGKTSLASGVMSGVELQDRRPGDAGDFLARAREELARGAVDEAARHLRSAVQFAAISRDAALQAEARLELAEIARGSGDLTTACEHWQIARALFHELARAEQLSETERLMRHHGCPTDWVLNDF